MPDRYVFIHGHYTISWSGSDLGTTRRGFGLRQRVHTEPIMVDEGGDVPVNAINRGTEYAVEMRDGVEFSKFKAALIASVGTLGKGFDKVGKLQTDLSAQLVLAPASGTGKTYTFPKAIVEGDVDIPLHLSLKECPMTFVCYPDPTMTTNALAVLITESGSDVSPD